MLITSKRLSNKAIELHIRVIEVHRDFNSQHDPLIKEVCRKLYAQAIMLRSLMIQQENNNV